MINSIFLLCIISIFSCAETTSLTGNSSAHRGDDADTVLRRPAARTQAAGDARRQRRDRQDGAVQRPHRRIVRGLHGHQHTVQLLHDVGDAAAHPREAAREEGRPQLRSAGHEEAHLLHRRHEHAGSEAAIVLSSTFIFDKSLNTIRAK